MHFGFKAKLKAGFGVSLALLMLTGGFRHFFRRDLISKAEDVPLVKEMAAGAERSTKTRENSSGLAFDLQKIVSNFKLGDAVSATWELGHESGESRRTLTAGAP